VLLAVAGLAAPRAGADMPEVRKRGQLRVIVQDGVSADFFSWKVSVQPGLEREMLQGFCRLQRVDLAIVPVPTRTGVVSALLKGEGDLAAGGLSTLDPGHADVEFTSEILPSRHVVVTRKPSRAVLTLEELRTQKVGTVRGSALAEAVSAAGVPDGQIDDSLAPGDLLHALKAGKVSACVLAVEQALPAQHEDPDLQLGMYLGGKLSVAFATRKEDAQLRGALDEYIGNLRRSAAFNRLLLSYFGSSASDILKASR
jgi:membrane-bound lytic murein transglycosylase MltF